MVFQGSAGFQRTYEHSSRRRRRPKILAVWPPRGRSTGNAPRIMCGAANSRALFFETSGCSEVQTSRMQRSMRAIPLAQTRTGVQWLLPNRGTALREHRLKTELNRRQSVVVSTRRSGETPDTEGEPARAKGPNQKADISPQEPRARASVCVCMRVCESAIDESSSPEKRSNSHEETRTSETYIRFPSHTRKRDGQAPPVGEGSTFDPRGTPRTRKRMEPRRGGARRKPNGFHPTSR